MLSNNYQSPDPEELRRRVQVFAAIKSRSGRQSNIWFFDSPKNNKRIKIDTDLAFMHLVLLEGDQTVLGYEPVIREDYSLLANSPSAAKIRFCDGRLEWWDFERVRRDRRGRKLQGETKDSTASSQFAADKMGAVYVVKTDLELMGKQILFDNWITICAAITRCRSQYLGGEADLFSRRMALQETATLELLLDLPEIDVANMLAVVGTALQKGTARTNLQSQLLSRCSLISVGAP